MKWLRNKCSKMGFFFFGGGGPESFFKEPLAVFSEGSTVFFCGLFCIVFSAATDPGEGGGA